MFDVEDIKSSSFSAKQLRFSRFDVDAFESLTSDFKSLNFRFEDEFEIDNVTLFLTSGLDGAIMQLDWPFRLCSVTEFVDPFTLVLEIFEETIFS